MSSQSQRTPGAPKQFFTGLQGARGIAALMVALLHVGQSEFVLQDGGRQPLVGAAFGREGFSIGGLVLRVLGNGHGAVIFFFVLSGFVLALMLQRGPQDAVSSARNFLVGRIFRIYPAVITTILAFIVVFALTGASLGPAQNYNALNLVLNALLVRVNINGVMWSLQLEMIAALPVFVAFLAWRRWGLWPLAAAIVALVALSFSGFWSHTLGLGPLYAFLFGMGACFYGRPLVERAPGPSLLWLAVGVLGFAAARPLLGWWSNWSLLFETIFASVIVEVLAFGTFTWTGGRRFTSATEYYGRISYSFYLLHPLTIILLWNIPDRLGAAVGTGISPGLLAFILFVVSVIVITPLAHLQYEFVERVGARWGRGLQHGRARAPQVKEASAASGSAAVSATSGRTT